jgi:hypothetical protein
LLRLVEPEGRPVTNRRLICDRCAEVIGVYEPLVVVLDGDARETSRAAEPTVGTEPAERYHRTCYLELFGPTAL